ncbi:hypothetical protein GCG54_00007958 [Colletotrichum gloeosporioides]|uniref:Uncharacterized protein n=1 Tax=Colletotrichum gloeosporioides TaxID=474922 RepID=A0A8H4C5Y4_COLGL|nr:uncharacterized protein GCG54_00007958 [Colletotrichum gloeosporioides]KAF3797905.1 hypothetical protein GCG54_00007958 [Colletotrichum gloeosporioides]
MVLEVGSLNRQTLEPFRTWQLERSGCEDTIDSDAGTDLFSSLVPRQCSIHHGGCPSNSAQPRGSKDAESPLIQCLELLATASPKAIPATEQASSSAREQSNTAFTLGENHEKADFDFPTQLSQLKLEKRRRPDSDVDGPHTAALSSKKRRLRLHLITSRLSQPYSLPATHIIHRDGAASGDKRFVKLAAVATSPEHGKSGFNRESSLMLRAAVLNRVRLRVRNEATQRGDVVIAVAAANAAVLHHGQQLATGARFVAPSSALAERQEQPPPRVERKPSPPRTPQSTRTLPKSPRLHPARSPNLAPSEAMLEELDDDAPLAFPTSDHDCQYAWADEDDLEDVYSDFGAIFGGSAQTRDGEDDGSYEEYLDELDGISWVGR